MTRNPAPWSTRQGGEHPETPECLCLNIQEPEDPGWGQAQEGAAASLSFLQRSQQEPWSPWEPRPALNQVGDCEDAGPLGFLLQSKNTGMMVSNAGGYRQGRGRLLWTRVWEVTVAGEWGRAPPPSSFTHNLWGSVLVYKSHAILEM